MAIHNIPEIVIAGTGRIAWHLGKRLKSKGLMIRQVYGRSLENAQKLALEIGAVAIDNPQDLTDSAGWVILAVKDDAIDDVAAQIAPYLPNILITHTSGATPGAVLAPFTERYGVFYPLQSFSHESVPVWSKIPFCVDASSESDLLVLKKIAKIIGNLVYQVNDDQRAYLHVAAVFANNFTNHCYSIAEQLLQEKGLSFELLHPLMEETLAKALLDAPANMQTGPAIRGDEDTLNRHKRLLESHPAFREIYEKMSTSIAAFQNNVP